MKARYLLKTAILGYCALAMASFSSSSVAKGVDDLIAGYGSNAMQLLSSAPNDVPYTQFTGSALTANNWSNPAFQSATAQTQQTLFQMLMGNIVSLADTDKSADNLIYSLTYNPVVTCPDAQPGAGFYVPLAQHSCVPAQGEKVARLSGVFPNYDLNSLIGPVAYTPQQAQMAKSFINNVAQLNTAFPIPDFAAAFASNKVDAKVFERPDVQRFLSDLRFLIAVRGAAVSNLYQIYSDRTMTPSAASSASSLGLSGDVQSALAGQKLLPQSSTLQVEQYMTNRRLADPKWVLNLSKDSPAALQRQMVVLLAENLAEQYKVRMSIERLNATMSMLLLQQSYTQRVIIEQQKPSIDQSK